MDIIFDILIGIVALQFAALIYLLITIKKSNAKFKRNKITTSDPIENINKNKY